MKNRKLFGKEFQNLISFFIGITIVWSAPAPALEEYYYKAWKNTFETKIYFRYTTESNYFEERLKDLYEDLHPKNDGIEKESREVAQPNLFGQVQSNLDKKG